MITRETILGLKDKWYGSLYKDVWPVLDELLKERDAYREVALHLQKYGAMISSIQPTEPIDGAVDAEAQRILQAKKEGV